MTGLDVRTRPLSRNVSPHPELAGLSAQIEERWPDLVPPIALEWSERLVVALDNRGLPWIYGPVERDPLRNRRGGTVIPRRERARLKDIAELGVPFQRLAIAHELDPDGPIHNHLLVLEEGPRTCTDEVARVLVGEIPAHPGVERAIQALDAVVGGTASAMQGHLLTTILDPIIFGVIAPTPPQHGQLCLWYPLAAWRW